MNWFAVLAHHAIRAPDRADHGLRGRDDHLRRDGCARGGAGRRPVRARRRSGRRRGAPLVQLPRVPRDGLRRQLPRRDRDADQLAAGRARGALHPRALRARAPWCATRRSSSWPTTRRRASKPPLVRACVAPTGTRRLDAARLTCGPSSRGLEPVRRSAADDVHRLMYTSGTTGRPKGVMITHANLAWKNLAHLVEFGFTSADLGLACGPLYHVGALDLTTTSLIARRRHDDHPPRRSTPRPSSTSSSARG